MFYIYKIRSKFYNQTQISYKKIQGWKNVQSILPLILLGCFSKYLDTQSEAKQIAAIFSST